MPDSRRSAATIITAPDDEDPRALAQRIVAEVLARHQLPAREVAEAAGEVSDVADDLEVPDTSPVSDAVRLARSIVASVLEERGVDSRGRYVDADGPPPLPSDARGVVPVLDGDERAIEEALDDPDTRGLTVAVGGVAVHVLEEDGDGEVAELASELAAADDDAVGAVTDAAALAPVDEPEEPAPFEDPNDPAVVARRLVRETLAAAAAREAADAEVEAADAEVEPVDAPHGPTEADTAPDGAATPEDGPTVALTVDHAAADRTAPLRVEDEPTIALWASDDPADEQDDDLGPPAAPAPAEDAWDEAEWHELDGDGQAPDVVDSALEPEAARADGIDLATLPPPEASPGTVLRSLDAPQPRAEAQAPRSRTGRWLLVTLLGAVGLALLLPLTVQALRTLITLN